MFVLDASVAAAWVLPEESNTRVDDLMDEAAASGALSPGIWPFEVGNALLAAERRTRITQEQRSGCLADLADLAIAIDGDDLARTWGPLLKLAQRHWTSLYDAAYLELALRADLPLATLDTRLAAAATEAGAALAL